MFGASILTSRILQGVQFYSYLCSDRVYSSPVLKHFSCSPLLYKIAFLLLRAAPFFLYSRHQSHSAIFLTAEVKARDVLLVISCVSQSCSEAQNNAINRVKLNTLPVLQSHTHSHADVGQTLEKQLVIDKSSTPLFVSFWQRAIPAPLGPELWSKHRAGTGTERSACPHRPSCDSDTAWPQDAAGSLNPISTGISIPAPCWWWQTTEVEVKNTSPQLRHCDLLNQLQTLFSL